jgi:hypothetical protein
LLQLALRRRAASFSRCSCWWLLPLLWRRTNPTRIGLKIWAAGFLPLFSFF